MDDDLEGLDREGLINEVKRLRAGIRAHRDSSGHDLCWHHPQLWALLPERIEPTVAVPLRLRLRRWAARSPSKLGDGLMALFGRAVRVALTIQRALSELNRRALLKTE
jgi:hypothetical protein